MLPRTYLVIAALIVAFIAPIIASFDVALLDEISAPLLIILKIPTIITIIIDIMQKITNSATIVFNMYENVAVK
jgi:hypothetical protein